ncbi:GNAT family N-acetyltransferase [Actinacidiphila oryziradicis]|uniref:GNAT family N-acetyltransferase n=1 Tax=Actinacidiphila oryziradicis TaxID=2571141 RepID=A0A4U0STK4_9ACTN|nr:GNAT family N-acetyltransferase [Actinacidiphila oryziradicis]TKA12793.1 GNAT family N-acetyltransferase [Actinacidiphila oryziradicis]
MDSVQLRLLREDDLQSAERASAVTFLEANRRSRRVSEPEIEPRSASVSKQWIDRIRFFLAVDPGGCWVAADGDDVIGFAISQNRGRVWFLATYGVLPGHQGMGIGKRLMDAVLAHSAGRQGMFISSVHPGATRRYRLAGFSLYPLMWMVGTVDRSTLPVVAGIREGQVSDLEWMDRLDQDLRGAGHGPDHGYMLDTPRLVVSRAKGRPGYVYIDDQGRGVLLAAARPETAQNLLWEALASSRGDTAVNSITTANEWAVDVGLAARLDIGQEGYLAVRGMKAPAPYLASGHFL